VVLLTRDSFLGCVIFMLCSMLLCCVLCMVVFVGGKAGNFPSLDLTFPPTGLSENLGGMERGRKGKGKGRVGRPPALLPPLASVSNTTLVLCCVEFVCSVSWLFLLGCQYLLK